MGGTGPSGGKANVPQRFGLEGLSTVAAGALYRGNEGWKPSFFAEPAGTEGFIDWR